MVLEKYRQKRHFEQTPEPPPRVEERKGALTFVIHKHSSRRLHYDLRLELDGVLKSWAVPKGPSLNPADKRLTVMVEDHPLGYGSFEGIIPKGEYGAGEVIVWDSGTYSPDEGGKLLFDNRVAAEEEMRRGLEKGKISFFLRGQKLEGSWTLVKMKNKGNNWLLMKHRDSYANPGKDILKEERSVATRRTVEDVRENRSPEDVARTIDPKTVSGAKPSPFLATVSPMLAGMTKVPFSDPGWIFEPKLDGYRTIAIIRNGKVTLLSRNGENVTEKYAALVADLARQPASGLILDGEIIGIDEKGKQCFQCLQNYLRSVRGAPGARQVPVIYYVFDILYLDGFDLRGAPLLSRKELLKSIFKQGNHARLIDYFEKEGETLFEAAVKNGLEGVIAKKSDSIYESGHRSPRWLKIKSMLSDDFIIAGYSVVGKARTTTFSSLLLGYYNDRNELVYAGHVGTGFDEKLLNEIRKKLDAIKTKRSHFAEVPKLTDRTTWVKPELVAEVKFSEWTQDGRLRHPSFVRLRDDKAPDEVRRSSPVTVLNNPGKNTDKADPVLEQLQSPREGFYLEAEGNRIKLSNLGKVLWPATGDHPDITKRDFLTYLVTVAQYMLPHLKDRPLTLSRYPDGIVGEHFWQKHWRYPVPSFVKRVDIKEEKGSRSEYMVCNNLSTLLWLGQVADLEFHVWFSRISAEPDMEKKHDTDYILDRPDFMIFDIDPYIYSGKESKGEEPELNKPGFDKGCEVADWLKEIIDGLGLQAFIKTSGKTGLHIYVPILRKYEYKAVRGAAEAVGKYLVQKHPKDVTTDWAQEKRRGKVFIDYGQNVRGKTLASIYSPRPVTYAAVSTPVKWEELGKFYPTDFTMANLPERLKKIGDLWADILSSKQDLGKALGKK